MQRVLLRLVLVCSLVAGLGLAGSAAAIASYHDPCGSPAGLAVAGEHVWAWQPVGAGGCLGATVGGSAPPGAHCGAQVGIVIPIGAPDPAGIVIPIGLADPAGIVLPIGTWGIVLPIGIKPEPEPVALGGWVGFNPQPQPAALCVSAGVLTPL